MYGSIKPKGLAFRRDIRSDFGGQQYYNVRNENFGGQQYYNVRNENEDLSETDFYSLSDEETAAAPLPVYSSVQKKHVKSSPQKYLFIEAKIDNNLPGWLKTTSLNRSWRTPLMNSTIPKHIKEEKEVVVTKGAPPPPPPRGKRNMAMNKKPSWRFQYGSTSSSLGSTGTTSQSITPSPQISNVPYKKSNNDNGTVRRPTNFDHHPIKCFANSIWKRTSKAFQGSSSSNTSSTSRSTKASSNENFKCDNKSSEAVTNTHLTSQSIKGSNENVKDGNKTSEAFVQEKNNLNQANFSFGSNTSINSVWTEDGRLITPPPRRKFQSQQNLCHAANINTPFNKNISSFNVTGEWHKNPLCKNKSSVETGSLISINRILTPTGLLTPPERIKSKMQFSSSRPTNAKTFDSNMCDSHEFKNIQTSNNNFHSNDSINRVLTPNGIITPPPRRCFNRSTLSLHNPSKCNGGLNQNTRNGNFLPINTSQSIQLGLNKDKVPLHQTPSSLITHTQPRVSNIKPTLIYELEVYNQNVTILL